jgi:hypothetical protein
MPPDQSEDYLFSQVRSRLEHGHPVSVEVHESPAGRKARLCANGWMVVLPVEHTSGWPATEDSSLPDSALRR